jgi:hypothetical protein
MKLERLPYSPDALVHFYDEARALEAPANEPGMTVEIVAEGRAARMWNPDALTKLNSVSGCGRHRSARSREEVFRVAR